MLMNLDARVCGGRVEAVVMSRFQDIRQVSTSAKLTGARKKVTYPA